MHAPTLPARYEEPRLLGAGGMGAVYAAFDRERGETVAVKVFKPAPGADEAAGRFLFQQEFWALASLAHPNLVAAFDYGEAEGTPYFSLELVDGADWGASFPTDEADVRAVLPGILAALGHLHGRGWVHADLKPENVRITSDGRVKVMDLGLLTRVGTGAGAIRGSLAYMAPEQVRQAPLDGRTDLYALGCLLYHALAGRPPFVNDSAPGLLRDQLDTTPVPPGALGVALAPALEGALLALLAKRPQDRPAHVWELAERLGIAMATEAAVGLLGSPLVGLEAVTEPLERRLLAQREGWFGCLVGPAGAGKSRVLAEARAKSQLRGDAVLAVRGEGADAPPYAAVRPWLRAIVAERPPSLERLGPAIARLVPEVQVAPAPPLEGMQERVRLNGALAELAKEAWPGFRVFLADDWHRLDPASQELILALGRVAGPAWCFVATSQDEAPVGAERLELPALDEAALRELAGNLLGQPAPEELAQRLVAASVGRPGQAEAVLQHWIATGALVHAGGHWEARPDADWELSGGLAQLAAAQLAALDAATARLLEDAALLGAEGPLPLLAAVAELQEADFFRALGEAEAAGVLERERERYRFTRPAQAEVLASARDAAAARAAHGRAANYWQWEVGLATPQDAPLDLVLALSRHRLASDDPQAGVPWALAGARRALAIFAVPSAERLLAPLLALDGLAPDARTEALALMGYAHRFAARLDDGVALYEQELLGRLEPKSGLGIEHRVSYGALLMQKGRYDDASAAFAEAIAAADAQDASFQAIRGRIFAGRMAVFTGKPEVARTYLGEAIARARAAEEGSPERALLAGALALYGYLEASAGTGHEAAALASLDEAVALSQAQGDLVRLYEALNTKGNVLAGAGRYRESREVYASALALCERMGTANEALVAHLNVGGGALELGDFHDALRHAELVSSLAGAQGRKFPQAYAEGLAGLALARLGRVPEGLARAARGVALARELGNKYLELNVLAYQARTQAFAGRLDEAAAAIAAARELAAATGNNELAPKLDRLEATCALDAGAADGFDRMVTAIAACRRERREADLAYLLTHLARWQARQEACGEAERQALEALALAKALELAGLEAPIQRALGLAYHGQRRRDQARQHFELAIAAASRLKDPLELLAAQAALGELTNDHGLKREAARRLEQLVADWTEADRAAFLSIDDRAAVLGGSGESGPDLGKLRKLTDLLAAVARADGLDAVMADGLKAFVELAGADRGFLLLYDGFEVVERVAYGEGAVANERHSTTLAQQVLFSGEPAVVEDTRAHAELDDQASIQALALRSALAVPLKIDTEVIGVLMADSQFTATGWSAADVEMAMALGHAVAIAVSRARSSLVDAAELVELELVERLALECAGLPSLAEIAELGLKAGLELVGGYDACLLVETAHGMQTVASVGSPAVSSTVYRWVVERGEPLHLVDAQSDEEFAAAASVMALGLRTIHAAPVTFGGKVLGAMYFESTRLEESEAATLSMLQRVGRLMGAFVARKGVGLG